MAIINSSNQLFIPLGFNVNCESKWRFDLHFMPIIIYNVNTNIYEQEGTYSLLPYSFYSDKIIGSLGIYSTAIKQQL